jgi:hypothetical protein
MGAVWNHQLRPECCPCPAADRREHPDVDRFVGDPSTNLTILGQPRRRPEGSALSLARASH